MMMRFLAQATALALLAAPLDAGAEEPCFVCLGGGTQSDDRPLTVEITSDLEFSRLALNGPTDGEAQIDPQTGSRRVVAGMVELGGVAVQGRGRITGAPLRPVRVDLPSTIAMSSPGGGKAELVGLATNLPAFPTLDANGVLEFSFGGRLRVTGPAGGNFRARIPISVDYD